MNRDPLHADTADRALRRGREGDGRQPEQASPAQSASDSEMESRATVNEAARVTTSSRL